MISKKEKEILFKDLAARLPNMAKVKVWLKDGTTEEGQLDLGHNYADVLRDAFFYNEIADIKPYLRSMSSMTEEEEKEFQDIKLSYHFDEDAYVLFDWLNANHFDYRGLIEKGLALEAPEGMYN